MSLRPQPDADIPSRLLEQHESWLHLGNGIKEHKEKVQALRERLKELELKQAELKFRQPPDTTRMLEEELLTSLRREEAKQEQMKANLLRNQQVLLQFEDGLDNLFIRLHGITVPGQEDYVKALGLEEKLQHCQQKLQYLVQRVCDLSPNSHSPSESNKALVKVRNLLEKATDSDPQNLKISLDAAGSSVQDPFEFEEKDPSIVPTREDIKRQGQRLVESNKRSRRKKLPTWTV
ncbi:coiled-coil domain-containing protein 183-like [Porphyrio hochstetteri]